MPSGLWHVFHRERQHMQVHKTRGRVLRVAYLSHDALLVPLEVVHLALVDHLASLEQSQYPPL